MAGDGMRCELIRDESGNVIARAQVATGISEEQRAAVYALVAAIARVTSEQDVAEAEAAEEPGRRQAEAIARVRARAGLPPGEPS